MPSSKGLILLCDDDRLILATLSDGLTTFGFEVIASDNGDDAILQARKQRPDLALLDLYMQGKSGMDVAGYFRDVLNIPFMFFSAHSEPSIVKEAIELGALGFLVKPLQVKQVVPELELAIARARSEAKGKTPNQSGTLRQASKLQGDDEVRAIAIGLLMERMSMTRVLALGKLEALAAQTGNSVLQAAQKMVREAETHAGKR